MRLLRLLALPLVLLASCPRPAAAAGKVDRKAVEALAVAWAKARPKTAFVDWDPKARAEILARAKALGTLPEGAKDEVVEILWKALRREWPKTDEKVETPYGPATWIQSGKGGRKAGLVLGLHGGGEGAGSASEAAGKWTLPGCLCMYPQGIRLVHDTWNTVHGERFLLTLIEIAKAQHGIDPDRVYSMGFSMGGTGSWFLAGRHPDLLAGAVPAHGVLMAEPKSQVATKEEVVRLQHGFVANVRNLPVWFYTGLEDRNCMPGTFLYAWDVLQELRKSDPTGYAEIRFEARPGVAHAFPPGEPKAGIDWVTGHRRVARPEKVVWEYASEPFPLPDGEDRTTRLPKRWFYWLRCERPADTMEVVASRRGNEIDLSVSMVEPEDVEVLLDPSMIDPSRDVVLRVDGKEVYRGRPVPDLVTVLESLDARLDRTLVFDRRVRAPAR